jgi:hypothetical protein
MSSTLSLFLSSLLGGIKTEHNIDDTDLQFALVADSCRGLGRRRAFSAFQLTQNHVMPKNRRESCHCYEQEDSEETEPFATRLSPKLLRPHSQIMRQGFKLQYLLDPYSREEPRAVTRNRYPPQVRPRKVEKSGFSRQPSEGTSSKAQKRASTSRSAVMLKDPISRRSFRWCADETSVGDRSPTKPNRTFDDNLCLSLSLVDAIYHTLEPRQHRETYTL